MMFFSLLALSMGLSLLVFLAGLSLSLKVSFDREKNSPFECGFTPKLNSRLPFSMRFFLISIVFIIFDVEIVLLFPFLSAILSSNIMISKTSFIYFLLVLILGLYHEINEGSIDWAS